MWEKIKLNEKQKNELVKKKRCFICHIDGCIKVIIECDMKSLENIAYFNCNRCNISGNMVRILSK